MASKKTKETESALRTAFESRERGDLVATRRQLQALLVNGGSEADAAYAKKIAPIVFLPGHEKTDVASVASEILGTTRFYPRPYILLAIALSAFAFMAYWGSRG